MVYAKWVRAAAAAVLILGGGCGSADAGFIGLPSMLGQMTKRISLGNYTLAPMAFTQFCLRYTDQCKQHQNLFRGGPVRLSEERWDDLKTVNKSVNASILPEPNTAGVAGEKWLVNPVRGDCNDYAVSKRAELLKRGWPARALLLSEVVTASGEGHLILVVRTSVGDLVLDNLSPQIWAWVKAPFRWVRMQTPKNPYFWASLASRSV
jgi:predicted transglutaminase-like cysteine proteinase